MRPPSVQVRIKLVKLETAIAKTNLTKSAFARKIGVGRTHLADLLSGRTAPGPKVRRRLLSALGGTFDTFFRVVPSRRSRRS